VGLQIAAPLTRVPAIAIAFQTIIGPCEVAENAAMTVASLAVIVIAPIALLASAIRLSSVLNVSAVPARVGKEESLAIVQLFFSLSSSWQWSW